MKMNQPDINGMIQPDINLRQPHRFRVEIDHANLGVRLRIDHCPGVDVGGCTEYDPIDHQLHPERGCVLQSWIDNDAVFVDEPLDFTFDGMVGWNDSESPYIDPIRKAHT